MAAARAVRQIAALNLLPPLRRGASSAAVGKFSSLHAVLAQGCWCAAPPPASSRRSCERTCTLGFTQKRHPRVQLCASVFWHRTNRSKGGSRLLQRWILQPLLDDAELRARQDMVEVFVDDAILREELKAVVVRAGVSWT